MGGNGMVRTLRRRCHASPARCARLPSDSDSKQNLSGSWFLVFAPVHPRCSQRLGRFLRQVSLYFSEKLCYTVSKPVPRSWVEPLIWRKAFPQRTLFIGGTKSATVTWRRSSAVPRRYRAGGTQGSASAGVMPFCPAYIGSFGVGDSRLLLSLRKKFDTTRF